MCLRGDAGEVAGWPRVPDCPIAECLNTQPVHPKSLSPWTSFPLFIAWGVWTLTSNVPSTSGTVYVLQRAALTLSYSGSHYANGPGDLWHQAWRGFMHLRSGGLTQWAPLVISASSYVMALKGMSIWYISPRWTSVKIGNLSRACQSSADLLKRRPDSAAHSPFLITTVSPEVTHEQVEDFWVNLKLSSCPMKPWLCIRQEMK